VNELVRACPRGRQTMLFSATVSAEVQSLVDLSLNNPRTVTVHNAFNVVSGLEQEFVRVRKDKDREFYVLSLCKHSFHSRVIVFIPSKAMCHRLGRWCDCSCHVNLCPLLLCSFGSASALVTIICVLCSLRARHSHDQYATLHTAALIFGLAELSAAELHGNLTQVQRLDALDRFKTGDVKYLLCTDLAARYVMRLLLPRSFVFSNLCFLLRYSLVTRVLL
jgi:ATP-dependent RNA helicase DDX27